MITVTAEGVAGQPPTLFIGMNDADFQMLARGMYLRATLSPEIKALAKERSIPILDFVVLMVSSEKALHERAKTILHKHIGEGDDPQKG